MKTPKFGRLGAVGLTMALLAALVIPAAAISQGKKGEAIPKAALEQGMKEAPAVVQAMSLPCQVSEARKIGEDKKNKTNYYEVACGAGAMGYVLQSPAEGAPTAFSCIEANTPPAPGQPPSAPCMLPGNANPSA
ncbi:MAG: hypothetical protein KIS90_16415, partial [Phenylobacterium sp.]|nr:hypothetical protein [Phenylobacterium sp.]